MIKGKQIQPKMYIDKPSVNYRKLDALNQSMIKLFDSDPVKFFDQFKMGKKTKEKTSVALSIGDLVDFYLLECGGDDEEFLRRFDEKFALFNGIKTTSQVFALADYLFEEAENCVNEFGEITCSFDTMFDEAVKKVQADGKYKGKEKEKILKDFVDNGKIYFDTKLSTIGKTVVDVSLVDKAKIVANKIKTDEFTRYIFMENNRDDIFYHFPIEWDYEINEDEYITCKSEIDFVIINHEKKIIQPIDLKTTYDNESFDHMYIKNKYYLQNAFYFKAVEFWAKANNLEEYEVKPMIFVVGDTSSNNRRPLVYITSDEDIKAGLYGFSINGSQYRGIDQLIKDIAWAEKNNEWSCSKTAFDAKGKLVLNINYDR